MRRMLLDEYNIACKWLLVVFHTRRGSMALATTRKPSDSHQGGDEIWPRYASLGRDQTWWEEEACPANWTRPAAKLMVRRFDRI